MGDGGGITSPVTLTTIQLRMNEDGEPKIWLIKKDNSSLVI